MFHSDDIDQLIINTLKHIVTNKLVLIDDTSFINLIQKENYNIHSIFQTIYNNLHYNLYNNEISIRQYIFYTTTLHSLLLYIKNNIKFKRHNMIDNYIQKLSSIIKKYDSSPIWFTIKYKFNYWFTNCTSYFCSKFICICFCMCDEFDFNERKIYVQPKKQ
jgi:hypothetical protein